MRADCGHEAPDDVEVLVDDAGLEYRLCGDCQPSVASAYSLKPKPKAPAKPKRELVATKVEQPAD